MSLYKVIRVGQDNGYINIKFKFLFDSNKYNMVTAMTFTPRTHAKCKKDKTSKIII